MYLLKRGQVANITIIVVIAFVLFILLLVALFMRTFVAVIINVAILYFLFLRIYTEITKYKRLEIYIFTALASFFILWITGNFLPCWFVTTLGLLTMLLVHLYLLFER